MKFFIFLLNIRQNKKINKLKSSTEDREKALIESEKMLKQDNDKFQRYLEQNKQQKVDAEQKADEQNKQKKQKEILIKEINSKLTSIKADISKSDELLLNYKEHKEFLDKLVPKVFFKNYFRFQFLFFKEWEEERNKKRQEFIQNLKQQWINKRLENIQEFNDNYPMYFNNHNQLIELFNEFEEKNLFLIQMKQEDESALDEIKLKFQQDKQVNIILFQQIFIIKQRTQTTNLKIQIHKKNKQKNKLMKQIVVQSILNKQMKRIIIKQQQKMKEK
ncbi:hypothetical protein IMG5_004010 [Ichthyophthirius multifiliis]|uniref:DUF4200 domain-containing protein n=1 Tax=Ichthyophthirius multifiliis TaxID=5932 RepID=G0QJC2_ICHMU|nr:hypothetical protein IMG5_004010 [Ichthyophthirius multifiliis]EGR34685.1 hypothetical protein IMG5_004010 [Ichthyophthirius multifiliis]|eukprot:XP_004039989.1 hypothetical protein IMG5_004010 [Ichthyophthirius multifiliis]